MSDDATRPSRHREFLWLMGGIGVLLVIVTFYRAGPIRGHPPATPAPTATASP